MLLITRIGRCAAALWLMVFTFGENAQAQAYLLPDAETYLRERTPNPYKPIGEPVGRVRCPANSTR
mgnify:CR=1 FL=1